MLLNRSSGIKGLSAFCLLALVTLSFWSWLFIWNSSLFSNWWALEKYSFYNEFLLIGVFSRMDGKRFVHGPYREFVEAVRSTGRQAFMGLFAVFIVIFAMQDTFISRTFLFSYIPWLCLTLLFANYVMPNWLGQLVFGVDRPERVALVGSSDQAEKIKPWIDRKRLIGLQAVGVICPNPAPSKQPVIEDSKLPLLGSVDDLSRILQEHSISHLIVLDLMIGSERLLQITQICEGAAVRLLAVDNLDSYFNHNTMVFEDDGVRLIGLREEPLESPINRIIKRIMDLAIALPVVLLLLPFTSLFVYVCHRLQAPGPLLYKQKRSGLLGSTFMIYKYRTMYVNNDNEARQASRNDRRIFPLGVWMRKMSIDELPQFINVLFGDMSVVGPRPHMLQHDDMFIKIMRNYSIRRFVHPGITGWAQVRGFRGEIITEQDARNRVEADIYYLENWSLSLDFLIILKTIKQCLFPLRTAY
jgi:putative colanic acid biosynthesis UDP-glucose lipid carrier transferase